MNETLIAVSKDALDELVTQITALSAKVNNLTSEVEKKGRDLIPCGIIYF